MSEFLRVYIKYIKKHFCLGKISKTFNNIVLGKERDAVLQMYSSLLNKMISLRRCRSYASELNNNVIYIALEKSRK